MAESDVSRPLPRWLRRAFKMKNKNKVNRIINKAYSQGFTIVDILSGYEQHKRIAGS